MQNIHIGPLPPVFNGISVYLYRLSKIEKNSVFIDWNKIKSLNNFIKWLLRQILSFKRKNFIFHPPSINQRLILFLMTYFSIHKSSLVIHGFPLISQYNDSSRFTRVLIRQMLNKAYYIQLVNPSYKIFLNHLKIKNQRIIVKNAYLPPPLGEEESILKSYDRKILDFVKNRSPLLIANAACIRFVKGIDGYGFDLCLELTRLLKNIYPNVGFFFALANETRYPDYFQKLKEKIKEYNIEDNFFFMTGQKELWPLFKKADLFLRPTISDGDAISIREALSFGCNVIASRVCRRPNGTVLFENRNIQDLFRVCKESLKVLKHNK
ncbi:MAG: glycosyltransferase [Candidatus Odinarchaeota archaeon]